MQDSPAQHPLGQVGQPEHAPPLQLWPMPHALQMLPPVPQAPGVFPAIHVPPTIAVQQPPHETLSQMHCPPEQRWPTAHCAPLPQRHAPPVHASDRVASHAIHAMPLAPHVESDGELHVVPLQHPLGHDVALQRQAPPTHCWPTAHAAPVAPHTHRPSRHMSERRSHATHDAPPVPQLPSDGALVHVVPLQQPVGHETPSHTHEPPTQRWPAAHTAPPPHRQSPLTHESARNGSHATHAAPGSAHALGPIGTHVEPEQQPLVHVIAHPAQTPPAHVSAPQFVHAEPPAPHSACAVPSSQTSPSQHPGQLAESHTQRPPAQRCPLAHCAPPPHVQAPPVHASASAGSHAMHTSPPVSHARSHAARHTSPSQHPVGHDAALHTQPLTWHSCPGAHAGSVPQRHVPSPAQALERDGSQATHVEPAEPHIDVERVIHALPSQHPTGHDVLVHTQSPEMHSCPPAHSLLVPHMHMPPSQLSLRAALQARHAAPGIPHALVDGALHVLPEQQPAHVSAQPEHAPCSHTSPAPHASHAPPADPQTPSSVPSWHWPASSQQPAHDAESQTHAPPSQR